VGNLKERGILFVVEFVSGEGVLKNLFIFEAEAKLHTSPVSTCVDVGIFTIPSERGFGINLKPCPQKHCLSACGTRVAGGTSSTGLDVK
jgi:hypothetical protein